MITDYASLLTALNAYSERSYASSDLDTFLGQAQPKINRRLTSYQRQSSAVVALVSGVGSLPADFTSALALNYSTYGTLQPVSSASLIELNPTGAGGVPAYYAIHGTQISVAPTLTGNVTLTYLAGVPALSSGNTTNWLLTAAPDAYLNMILAESKMFEEDFQTAALFEGRGTAILDGVNMQAVVAAYSRAGLVTRGPTP